MSHNAIVQELQDQINSDAEFKQSLESGFALAYASGISQFTEYNIHNLDDFLKYLDEYVNWVPTENRNGTNVYDHICLCYFVFDLPAAVSYQDPIEPSQITPKRFLTKWLIKYAQEMGRWMDTPESISPEAIATFYAAEAYHMQDYPVPEEGWNTFNEFFARKINPDVRPIASPADDSVIVSPADCSFDGVWDISDPNADITIKGIPWTIQQLLEGYDQDLGKLFAGGKFTHSFLGPADYHRQHAPVSGRVVTAKVIPGICYLEVVLHAGDKRDGCPVLGGHRYMRRHDDKHIPKARRPLPMTLSDGPGLDAPDSAGYQFLQARGLILIDNPVLGLVAVLPVGMAQVSSVVPSVKAGDIVRKGDEISKFQLGGSDICMVFQKGANVTFHQEIGKHYNFGVQVAKASPA
ncbi:phosphatidylserine decarboxylase-domain-containing protein [Auriculariales sp. MPI-PUGE-AT-0066]|nr:phosphatidylserine decarboxylase-domain-containing protein [Auriculariales sp. MPI-PUGE-AT-0066]